MSRWRRQASVPVVNDTESRYFTLASMNDVPALLFFNPSETGQTADEVERIAADPLYRTLFEGTATTIYPEENNGEKILVASPELGDNVFATMESAAPDSVAAVVTAEGKVESIKLYDTYYGCTLPQKLIVGCEDCYKLGSNERDCALKRAALRGIETPRDKTADELYSSLVSRRSKLSGYTFVGPRLTAPTVFSRAFRPIEEHRFGCVHANSEVASQAAKERERRLVFLRKECQRCFVKTQCHEARSRHEINDCPGPYAMTPDEAAEVILKDVTIPYTPKQLLTCLAACGPLNKRYNSCIHCATFAFQGQILTFGFRRLHRPRSEFVPLLPGKELDRALEEYCGPLHPASKPLTAPQKALLCEIAAVPNSPHRGNGWHKTQYPSLYLEYDGSRTNPEFTLRYKWRSGRRGILPWRLEVRTLADFYANYGGFSYLNNELTPNARSRYRWQKFSRPS